MVLPLLVGAGIALAAGGAVTSFLGTQQKSKAEQAAAQAAMRISGLESQVEGQKRQAMEIDARRRQLEAIRSAQRARAMGLTVATSQGSQGGSGLQGAYGQFSGGLGTNLLGIFQNLELGRNIFDINQQIGGERIAIAGAQRDAAKASETIGIGSGLTSLGGSFVSGASTIGNLTRSSTVGN